MPRRFRSLALLLCFAAALLVTGCDRVSELVSGPQGPADTTRAPGVPPPGEGLVTTAVAGQSVAQVAQQLRSAVQASGATLTAEIDHAANAAGASGDSLGGLRPMRLLLFGNQRLGTPLMQDVRTTGLDLPQKLLVWQGSDDSTRITYNMPAYLAARHDLSGSTGGALGRMGGVLTGLVEQAAGRAPDTMAFNADSISAGAGLAIETSDFGVGETFRRLQSAVQSQAGLRVMARVNHAGVDSLMEGNGDAQQRGGGLPPVRLLIFGNPDAGTPLMRQAPTMGIDLPQKMLVYEGNEGNVYVAYNEPAYLARRHQVADTTGLSQIAQMLEDLSFQATADEQELQEIQEAREDSSGVAF